MKKLGRVILSVMLACAVLAAALSSCSGHETPEPPSSGAPSGSGGVTEPSAPSETEKPYKDGTYTLMIYMCGSNLETKTGAATKNITEMLSSTVPADTRVIIQTGGANAWRRYKISPEHSSRYEVIGGALVLIEQNPVVNMGLPSTLADFLLWGDEHYPAEHRSLILWDHGGGTMNGLCYDEQFNFDALTLPEFRQALSSAFEHAGRKYDFIGFDACLMANYDTACIVRDYADYMIASEEREPASGWDYRVLLSNLGRVDFYRRVLDAYAEKQVERKTYTLSAIRLSGLSRAESVLDAMVETIYADFSCVATAIAGAKEFGDKIFPHQSTNLFDLGLLAEAVGVDHDFSDFIMKANGSAHEKATGLSLYFPTEQQEQLDTYANICANPRYLSFLADYFQWQPSEPIRFLNYGYNADGHLAFILSDQSNDYVQAVGYALHSYAGSRDPEQLYFVGTDNDITSAGGVYTVNFNGRWVFLGDMMLHSEVYEETPTHTTFTAPVLINGEAASLLFTYSGSAGELFVDGYLLEGDTSSRVNELTAGTEVSVIYKAPLPGGSETYVEGPVVWGDDHVVLTIRSLNPGRYQYIPYVVDIYGNVYYAYTATVYFDGTASVIEDISAG